MTPDLNPAEFGAALGSVLLIGFLFFKWITAWMDRQLEKKDETIAAERIETKKVARELIDKLDGTIAQNTRAFEENTRVTQELCRTIKNGHR